jgi:hypothetical protein
MKRLVMVIAAVVVLVPATVWAQDVPKAEVFGGFSWLTAKFEGDTERFNPVGWQAAVQGNVSEMFSIVGDVGGVYKEGAKIHSFLGGARVTRRTEKASIFGHALYGVSHTSAAGFSDNAFTMGYGGGIDVNAGEKLAIRVVQFDWLPSRSEGVWSNNIFRFGFGIVFKSGMR